MNLSRESCRLPTPLERRAAVETVNNRVFTMADYATATASTRDTASKAVHRLLKLGRVERVDFVVITAKSQRSKAYRRKPGAAPLLF